MAVRGSEKKYIYVTGCDTGFGEIVAKKLDQLGFGVFAGVYLPESIDKLKSSCSNRMHPIRVDVSDEDSVENAASIMKETLAAKGALLHGVVNNAGILVQPGPVEWTPTDAYRRMFNVNVMGTVMTTKSLLPLLRKSKGRIVNVASIAGRIGLPTQPAYCMSKYGVEGYSEVLRRDMLSWGVTVHIVEPGVFSKTGLYDQFETGLDRLWQNLSPEVKADYGEDFYKFLRKALTQVLLDTGNTNSELVPLAMVEALVSEKPKYRYRVGHDSKYLITVIEKLHESTQDAILTASNPKLKAVLPKTAPPNGKAIATSRYNKGWPQFLIICAVLLFVLRKLRS
mmetsp:Transcript_5979/g.6868  ORF Transcript_5979/g.6868 Transcript_5979/m.6868 type:complete len:339 (-) Transcript_5979:148-1164(-)